MSQSQGDVEENQVLTASVHDVKHLAALFRGISFSKMATFTVTDRGITVAVEESRTLLATAYIFTGIFDEFTYKPEAAIELSQAQDGDSDLPNVAFEININALLECMYIFGPSGSSASSSSGKGKRWGGGANEDNDDAADRHDARIDQFFGSTKGTGMRMSYAGPGYPLTLLIAEESGGPTATCEITTFDPEPQLELPFDPSQTVLKIILKSSWLRDALSEIDSACEKLTIIGNPPPPGRSSRSNHPRLRLQAAGTFGSTEMDYPSDKEVLETCECDAPVSFSYKFSHISRTLRALQGSTKTSLRIDDEGLLSLQFLMPSPKPRGGGVNEAFIEFRCLALDDNVV